MPTEFDARDRLSVAGWNFDNTYTRLPELLFRDAQPASFPAPQVAVVNHRLAEELGLRLNELSEHDLAAMLSGQLIPNGAHPIAQAYAGHQFGGFTMLGDGRAILLGEHRSPSGPLFDIQFKGSGQTPFSRRGDGRAALGPMLREYIISEAMAALGIPTTRSLAVVTTGEQVRRETPLQGSVLTRVASSHLRVGTFQFLAARQDDESLRVLADYTISRHDRQIAAAAQAGEFKSDEQKYRAFLLAVIDRQAALIARWQLVGFIHGVMNTDNVAISGETIDYGPCAFMDTCHPATVFSSIDERGRYAYGNQPAIGQWNLARFAETLLPLLAPEQEQAIETATECLNEFPSIFERYWLAGMRRKLGLVTEAEGDRELVDELLDWMKESAADFTNTFDDLTEFLRDPASPSELPLDSNHRFDAWRSRWLARLKLAAECQSGEPETAAYQIMRRANPAIIPRNHRVEEALAAATEQGDLSVMHRLLEALATPYAKDKTSESYRTPPPAGQPCYRTFCGT